MHAFTSLCYWLWMWQLLRVPALTSPWWQTITQDGELKNDFCQGVLSQQQKWDYDDYIGIHIDVMETHRGLWWERMYPGCTTKGSNPSLCSISLLALLLHSESQFPLEEATLKQQVIPKWEIQSTMGSVSQPRKIGEGESQIKSKLSHHKDHGSSAFRVQIHVLSQPQIRHSQREGIYTKHICFSHQTRQPSNHWERINILSCTVCNEEAITDIQEGVCIFYANPPGISSISSETLQPHAPQRDWAANAILSNEQKNHQAYTSERTPTCVFTQHFGMISENSPPLSSWV